MRLVGIMSNYIEYKNKIVFHPGYYIKEIIEDYGLTQEDFAKRLDTTAKNISLIIRGEQSISIDIATKLSRMLGTSIIYWLNLQNIFDISLAELNSEKSLAEEKKILEILNYNYFCKYYDLPKFDGTAENKISLLRKFLNISSLSVLAKKNLAVSFRSESSGISDEDVIKANAMVQIATNQALSEDSNKFNKHKFEASVDEVLKNTCNHTSFYKNAKKAFSDAGVKLVAVPNISNSKINGATKKIGDTIMLMINNRESYGDSIWFTMFHEIGHIMEGDFGISLKSDRGDKERIADKYAREKLIPDEKYEKFIYKKDYSKRSIKEFAADINRDPGIVVGRLIHDKIIDDNLEDINSLRKKYGLFPK